MHASYSLRIPKPAKGPTRRRKRKVIPYVMHTYQSYKYRCIECASDVYFAPGHELVCTQCASRTVEKVPEAAVKRLVSPR